MPDQFGRYELHDLLGRGGMGEVYRAYDTVRDRTVALKLLPKHLAADESFKTRFRRESQMAARLHEPHIIPIHDFGEIEGTLFIDMRLVEGEDLGTLLSRRGALSLDTAVSIVGQMAAALDAAHESGLVHRDVKPSNVLLTGVTDDDDLNPFAYLVDFGIARSSTQEGTALTATSGTIGTVAYMSPERIGGEHGDRRTDIYALACVLYETLTGRKPFEGELFAIMFAHVNTPPPTVSDVVAGVPPAIDTVIRTGMAKNPDDRYPTAGAFAAAARQALRDAPGDLRVPVRPAPLPPPPSEPLPPAPTEVRVPTQPTPGPAWSPTQPTPPAPPGPPPGPAPGPWPQPGPHTPLPPRPPGPRPPGGTSRRKPILISLALLVAAAVAIALVLALGGGGNSPVADDSGSPVPTGTVPNSPSVIPTPTAPTSSGPASLDTGPADNTVNWAHFAAFSKLVGTSDNDTAHAFGNATCKVEGSEGSTDIQGIVDQVKCTMSSNPVVIYVARFSGPAAVNTYVWKLLNSQYGVTPWQESGGARGLEFQSPSSSTSLDITTTICGLPNYLVQFYIQDASQSTMTDLHTKYWNSALFPDVVPPACRADFLGAATGTSASYGATANKTPFVVDETTLDAFLSRRASSNSAITVPVTSGSETMLLTQTGDVSFWSLDDSNGTITRVGHAQYPYHPDDLGPPNATGKGQVLDNMDHPTFIVSGTFSADNAGNAVAFTNGGNGWAVVKAQGDGNLAPSGTSIGTDLIGLSEAFDFNGGDLMTADCSSQLPVYQCHGNDRVIKYWTWNPSSNEFVQTGHAGRTQ